jgi:hypothetical protein
MTSEWHDWHDFYVLLGTSSAALVALLFVAVSIGASFLTPERSIATSTFMSPVVFHFATILLLSLIALVPSHTTASLAVGIALVAVAGLGYTTVVPVSLARRSAIPPTGSATGFARLRHIWRFLPRPDSSLRAPHSAPISWRRPCYSFSPSIFATPGIWCWLLHAEWQAKDPILNAV